MIKVPVQAINPFINEEIELYAPTQRDQLVKPIKLDACVMLSDPYALGDGIGPDGSKTKYSVMIVLDKVESEKIIPGAWIAPNGRRPKLMVTSVHPNGDCLWMDCTATQGAV